MYQDAIEQMGDLEGSKQVLSDSIQEAELPKQAPNIHHLKTKRHHFH